VAIRLVQKWKKTKAVPASDIKMDTILNNDNIKRGVVRWDALSHMNVVGSCSPPLKNGDGLCLYFALDIRLTEPKAYQRRSKMKLFH
jgi:hypothetical protein